MAGNSGHPISEGQLRGLMISSHCTGMGPVQVQGMGPGVIGLIYCTEMFTLVPDRERKLRPIVSYCAGSVPCTYTRLVSVQCE